MERKCPVCGSTEIITGTLLSTGGVVFTPEDQPVTRIIKKSSYIKALACKKCGEVFGFKLADIPTKLTD
ncbi:MAG: hypothetical protein IJZ95_00450 [Oscillospiraceae bacterium]|nr:hypothetical protein [Oscillospiraceae bacterium]